MFMEPPLDKLEYPPFLGTPPYDPSLFEEIPLEIPDEGAFSSLGDLFGAKEVKEA